MKTTIQFWLFTGALPTACYGFVSKTRMTTASSFVHKPSSSSSSSSSSSWIASSIQVPAACSSRWILRQTASANDSDSNDVGQQTSQQKPLSSTNPSIDRRQALVSSLISVVGGLLVNLVQTPARADEGTPVSMGSSPNHPIVVIGAGGKVGTLCTRLLSEQGLYTRAVTRSGRAVLDKDSAFVSYGVGDVTKYDSITTALSGASAVIFAASASGKKKGGDPAHVDYLGVYNTAKACLDGGIPKLVVVSAAAVTRPDSIGFKATTAFVNFIYGKNIMDYKMAGEQIMRDLYDAANNPNVAYAVIRPGGLNEKSAIGPMKIHVSQGDVYVSEITRDDVAGVAVAALLKGKATDNVTLELNQVEGLTKSLSNLPDLPAELVHTGVATYDGLLDGLLTDSEMRMKYPNLMNDFRGNDIEPVEALMG